MRKTVCIAGLGLLGTSLCMALDSRKYRITAWCRNPETARWVLDQGIAEQCFESPEQAFAESDLLCLCLPIPVITDFILRYGPLQKPGALLTDIGSVKGVICQAAESVPNLRFIGSHPMAGTEKSGPYAAFPELFENADVFMTPPIHAEQQDTDFLKDFWESIHTHVRFILPEDHDSLVANTSHMLHIIASALSQSILDAKDYQAQRRHYAGCATGFRDTSRIASSSPVMWRQICSSNVPAILQALDAFGERLEAMRKSLEESRFDDFEILFTRGKYLRDSWLCYKAANPLPRNITLCGIKHAGKTSAGKELSRIMALDFADSDDAIQNLYEKEHGEKPSVREIYKKLGETAFRQLEARAVRDLCSDGKTRVIALGGGALSNPFITEQDREKLGFICCLDVRDDIAYQRILEHGLPPFLQHEEDPFKAFCESNRKRMEVFKKEADTVIRPADFETTPRDVALHILSAYKDMVL